MSKAFTGAVVAAVGADEPPFDAHVLRLRSDPRVTMFLLPLPQLAKSSPGIASQGANVGAPKAAPTGQDAAKEKVQGIEKVRQEQARCFWQAWRP